MSWIYCYSPVGTSYLFDVPLVSASTKLVLLLLMAFTSFSSWCFAVTGFALFSALGCCSTFSTGLVSSLMGYSAAPSATKPPF